MNTFTGQTLSVDSPAVYCIQVQGAVSQEWLEDLFGLQVYLTQPTQRQKTMTTLIGELKDQAMLSGLLNLLQDLGLPLLAVNCLGRPIQSLDGPENT